MPIDGSAAKASEQLPDMVAERWLDAIIGWHRVMERDSESPDDVDILQAYLHSFWDILNRMGKAAAPHDEWDAATYGDSPFIQSKKLGARFSLGFDLAGRFRMTSGLLKANYLRRMTDDFWRHLLEIPQFGDLSFEGNLSSSKLKCIIWKLRDEYNAAENAGEQGNRNAFIDFGSLVVTWAPTTPLIDLFDRGRSALCRLYRLNYLLYRDKYLLQKRRESRGEQPASHADARVKG